VNVIMRSNFDEAVTATRFAVRNVRLTVTNKVCASHASPSKIQAELPRFWTRGYQKLFGM